MGELWECGFHGSGLFDGALLDLMAVSRRKAGESLLEGLDVDRLATEFHHHPCPALNADGCCGVYSHRPLVCRSMGIPTDDRGLAHGACEIQTFIPIVRLPIAFREEEDRLAQEEAASLETLRQATGSTGEEVFLPYGFLSEL